MQSGDGPSNSSRQTNSGKYRQSRNRGRGRYADGDTKNRLHDYLRDLQWGMASSYDECNDETHTAQSNEEPTTWHRHMSRKNNERRNMASTDDQWKHMMRYHGAGPDTKYEERSANQRKKGQQRRNNLDGCNTLLYESALEEFFRTNDIYQDDENLLQQTFERQDPETSTDDGSPMILEHEIHFAETVDQIPTKSWPGQREFMQNAAKGEKGSDEKNSKQPNRYSTKIPMKQFDTEPIFDVNFEYEEPYVEEKGTKDDEKCRDLASSLRTIAMQIESIAGSRDAMQRERDEICKAMGRQLHSKHSEIMQLRSQIAAHDVEKHRLKGKVEALEAEMRRLKLTRKRTSTLNEGEKEPVEMEGDDTNEMETVPPFILEHTKLDSKLRSHIKKLQMNLYLSNKLSATPTFQAELYRDLRNTPEIVNCREIFDFINESIRNDAELLHTRIRHSALMHGVKRMFVEDHLSPFTNRYPYPPEFEQKVIEEMENSHPSRRFNMDPSQMNDVRREKVGLVLNRIVLRSVFKYSHINNLYNYLFTALYCDNFRVVDILKDAIVNKFLDFQMAPEYNKRVSHPMMWAFGDACNATQAYRYMKMLGFDFASFPSDPHDGENLWHRVVKGDAVAVAQALKPYTIHTGYMSVANQRNETPLDISNGKLRRELLTLVVVEIASKGSDKYRDNDFEGALELYSEAISKQLEAMSIDTKEDNVHRDVNLGKLYYNKARSLMHLDRWTETVEACELCMEHIPTYTNAYVTCIQAYEKLLDWNNAVKTCCLMRENCGVVDDEKMETLKSQIGATMFQILGLPNSASPREIKQAFNQLCKQWHPDKIGLDPANGDIRRRAMNQFNRLYEARETLLDDSTRLLEQSRPETQYKAPEPMVDSSRKCSESGEPNSSKIDTLQAHLSKLKADSQNDSDIDGRILQTAVDRLQQQIDQM
ncbi:DnaJ -like protein [Babesia sp. Xinjiang]|uniref:DnaJ -like protein n=1 Tax=Babesia sp. Xinjiang TaxID=462227 RepID=UPI000A21B11E|nr:DnaJ -like protein [Babesia sp. Xinjiang]ORM42171.1 DnaJ -like protein [Babesia sp. Xinjiang]